MGWEGGKAVALSDKKRKLDHVTERETDILLEPRSPIQCERIQFPASFASSAGTKNISWDY